jgi:uncharacterized membrane protein
MATTTITRLYDTYDEATRAVQALEAAGVPHADISLVGSAHDRATEAAGESTTDTDNGAATGAGTGATLGTLVGGGAGLLAGIGALAIPGVGPIVAAGWLVAALTGAGVGAAAGGLLGSLTGAGVSEEDAHVYAEGVRRGGTMLTARVDEGQAARVESVLASGGHVDVAVRRSEYQSEGWSRFDPAAPALTATDVQAERKRRVRVS